MRLLSIKQVQDELGVSRSTVERLLGNGLPYVQFGPHCNRKVLEEDLRSFIKMHRRGVNVAVQGSVVKKSAGRSIPARG